MAYRLFLYTGLTVDENVSYPYSMVSPVSFFIIYKTIVSCGNDHVWIINSLLGGHFCYDTCHQWCISKLKRIIAS